MFDNIGCYVPLRVWSWLWLPLEFRHRCRKLIQVFDVLISKRHRFASPGEYDIEASVDAKGYNQMFVGTEFQVHTCYRDKSKSCSCIVCEEYCNS